MAELRSEFRSLIGFTRIESPGDYSELSNLPEEKQVPLSVKPPSWVPTSVVRGEGVFLHFSEDAIESWLKKVKGLNARFYEAHKRWRRNRGLDAEGDDSTYPTMQYVLLHSLSHALIRQFSLECGYTT